MGKQSKNKRFKENAIKINAKLKAFFLSSRKTSKLAVVIGLFLVVSVNILFTTQKSYAANEEYNKANFKKAYDRCMAVGGYKINVDIVGDGTYFNVDLKSDGTYADKDLAGKAIQQIICYLKNEHFPYGEEISASNTSKLINVLNDIEEMYGVYDICIKLGGSWGLPDSENPSNGSFKAIHNDEFVAGSCSVPKKILPQDECVEGKNGIFQATADNDKYSSCFFYTKNAYHSRSKSYFESMKHLKAALYDILKNNITPENKENCEILGYRWVPAFNPQPAYCATTDESGEEIDAMEELGINDLDEEDVDAKSTCAIGGGLGFIICPVMTTAGDMMGSLYDYVLGSMLEIEASTFGSEGVKAATNAILPIANLVLAILFLLVIYSEATGGGFGGLSNYNLKKTLPRLIIFAVMINISFYICAAAIDISNIFGSGIANFFDEIKSTIALNGSGGTTGSAIGAAVGLTALVGTVVAASLIFAGPAVIAAIFPVVLAGLAAIISTLLILLIRKVAIVALVVLSPVAFAMAILPNTKSLFNKWLGMFKSMLIVYPTIGLVIGASGLLSAIVGNTASDLSGLEELMTNIAAIGAAVLPLFAVPVVAKGALNGLGKMGTMLTKGVNTASLNNAAQKNMKREVSDAGKRTLGYNMYANSKRARRNALNKKAGIQNANKAGKFRKAGIGNDRFSKALGVNSALEAIASGSDIVDKEEEAAAMKEANAFAEAKIRTMNGPDEIYNAIHSGELDGVELSEHQMRAFIDKGMPSMDVHQIEGIIEKVSYSDSAPLRDTVLDVVENKTKYSLSGARANAFKNTNNIGKNAYDRQAAAVDQLKSISTLGGGDKVVQALLESSGTGSGHTDASGAWSAGSDVGHTEGQQNYDNMLKNSSFVDVTNNSKEGALSKASADKKSMEAQKKLDIYNEAEEKVSSHYEAQGKTFDPNNLEHLKDLYIVHDHLKNQSDLKD